MWGGANTAIKLLRQVLNHEGNVPTLSEQVDLAGWVAKLRLESFGLTQAVLAQNPKLSDIVKSNPILSSRFSAALAADLDVRILCDEDIEIAALVTQASKENRENRYG